MTYHGKIFISNGFPSETLLIKHTSQLQDKITIVLLVFIPESDSIPMPTGSRWRISFRVDVFVAEYEAVAADYTAALLYTENSPQMRI